MKIDPNAPVFAAATCGEWQTGLTIRAHFASLAMQAHRTAEPDTCADKLAAWSVADADALIAELNKETTP